jgi:hypothetical protein
MPTDLSKVISLALTTGDIAQPVTYDNILFKDVNIHVYGADVLYGSPDKVTVCPQSSATPNCGIIRANAVVWFNNCYIKDLFFKSYVNATPGYVVVTGTV